MNTLLWKHGVCKVIYKVSWRSLCLYFSIIEREGDLSIITVLTFGIKLGEFQEANLRCMKILPFCPE